MLKILNEYKEKGWVVSQKHPDLPLTIWNYSRTCEYEGRWDEVTVQCRGLITYDETGEVVARPFKKFWNMEEGNHTATKDFEVFEKLDGSLIIAFYFQGMWITASKGSFISDQAKAAQILLNKMNTGGMNLDTTYLFEFTAPWNRIVVKYGDEEKITLLGAIRTEDGLEAPYDILRYTASVLGVDLVKKYDGVKDYKILKGIIKDDEEGRVIKFSNGDRMKVKGEEYFRLHKIMTDVSTTAIWRYLKDGSSMEELLTNVPDEFFDIITKNIKEQKYHYMMVVETIGKRFDNYLENRNQDLGTPKEYSDFVNLQEKNFQGVLWRMYYNRDYSQAVWAMIRPEFRKL